MMRKIFFFTFFSILPLFLLDISHAAVQPPKNPNSAKSCAICHYRWVDTFFTEGKGSDLVEYQSEKVVATPEMCFSCHDGSIMDSRARLGADSGHKTNVAPPSDMNVPKLFPLDESGKMTCATCHTAHGVPSGPDSEETIFMRTSNKNSAMCRMCHQDMEGGLVAGNHPLDSTKLEIPAKLIELGATAGRRKNQIICESCHVAHGSPYDSFLVESTDNSGLCLDCHRDKEIFTPDGKKKPFHVINVAPVKAVIPDKLIEKGAKLGDKGVITCQTCHKVHNNTVEQHLLLIQKDQKSTLCLTCHTDKQFLVGSKHNLARSAPTEKNLEGKTVTEAGVCSACHLPHRSARRLSGEKDFTTQLCLSCHGKGSVAEKVNLSGKTHPLIVNPFEKKDTNGALSSIDIKEKQFTLPLFNQYGVADKSGKMTCATCHDPHGSRVDSVMRATAQEGKQNKDTHFLRKPSPDICRECHNNKFAITDSKHNLQRTAPGEKNILNQTFSESGLCGSCHLVHGSQKGFLWARPFAAVKGNNGVQGMCYSCHNEKGIAKKKVHTGYSHPINISPSKKSVTTDLPLLNPNGKYSNGGVMTCHTCHDPHKWQADSTGAEIGKDGKEDKKATSFLRKSSPDICRDCHSDKFAVAKSKHDLNKVAPAEKNILEQTPAESGLCGTCHLVHNAQQSYLWARKMSTSKGSQSADLCLGCHSESGPARKKTVNDYSHPVDISPSKKGLTTSLPLFGPDGKMSKGGVMTCHTCHDPHRWDPLKTPAEDHFDIEGSSQNSFLRLANSHSAKLCENCHPDQAYIEKTDHDLLVTAPDSKNIIDQTPAESGTCGVCHLVHNGKNRFKLWAQGFGPGDSLMDRMCNSCHSKGGWAQNKIPLIATHPISNLVNLGPSIKGRPSYIPIFDRISGEAVTAGEISCPSCHNVHQWNPESPTKGQGANAEGNATDSFLRSRSSILKCKDCHSMDALFKFKFFHDPGKRKYHKN